MLPLRYHVVTNLLPFLLMNFLSYTRASQDEWVVYREFDKNIKLVKNQSS